jgi:hypothetical protein
MNTFHTPPRAHVAEGWAVVGIVALMVFLLWLAI